jgi:hypothetical protein
MTADDFERRRAMFFIENALDPHDLGDLDGLAEDAGERP